MRPPHKNLKDAQAILQRYCSARPVTVGQYSSTLAKFIGFLKDKKLEMNIFSLTKYIEENIDIFRDPEDVAYTLRRIIRFHKGVTFEEDSFYKQRVKGYRKYKPLLIKQAKIYDFGDNSMAKLGLERQKDALQLATLGFRSCTLGEPFEEVRFNKIGSGHDETILITFLVKREKYDMNLSNRRFMWCTCKIHPIFRCPAHVGKLEIKKVSTTMSSINKEWGGSLHSYRRTFVVCYLKAIQRYELERKGKTPTKALNKAIKFVTDIIAEHLGWKVRKDVSACLNLFNTYGWQHDESDMAEFMIDYFSYTIKMIIKHRNHEIFKQFKCNI